ncbi:MAG: integrase [Planctomycetes bacterium]|nr:integrase [Planctomycetota bacterium]
MSTSTALTLHPAMASAGELALSPAQRLLDAFLSGRSPQTIRAYRQDLEDFRAFMQAETVEAAVRPMLAGGPGSANELALRYKADLMSRGLAPATVNRRLAALRSMVKLAKTIGLVPWNLEIKNAKAETYRDTRGPGRGGVRQLVDLARDRGDAKGARDLAIIRCLYDLGLRRAEVVRLDLEDLDVAGGTVAVLGKGRTQTVKLTLPAETNAALEAWIAQRGAEPGALFVTFDPARKGPSRLTGSGLYRMVRGLGARLGMKTRPHGLRHAAITEVLDLSGGDVRAAAKFSRHRDLRVLTTYDDSRHNHAGELARRLAAGL